LTDTSSNLASEIWRIGNVRSRLSICTLISVALTLAKLSASLGAGKDIGWRLVRKTHLMERVDPPTTGESSATISGLAWKKRATVAVGATHRRRTWESWCGWYRIVHSRCLYGPRKGRQSIADVWYATKLAVESGNVCWEVISRHRQRGPAVRACEKDARQERDETQVCDRCGERPPSHFGVPSLFDGKMQLCEPCWDLFRQRPRSPSIPPVRSRSVPARKHPVLPDQMSFDFICE
jgi:hypothetical protein